METPARVRSLMIVCVCAFAATPRKLLALRSRRTKWTNCKAFGTQAGRMNVSSFTLSCCLCSLHNRFSFLWQNLLLLVERMNKCKLHVPFFRSTLCFGRTSEMLQFLLRWTASSAGSESSNFFHHILCFLSLLCCTSLILVVRPSKLVPVVVKYFHFSIVLFCRSGTVREEGCSLEACALGLDDPCTPAE